MMQINIDFITAPTHAQVKKGIDFFKTLDLKTKLSTFDWNSAEAQEVLLAFEEMNAF